MTKSVRLWRLQPILTWRGAVLLAGSMYFLVGPWSKQADLVAGTVGAALLLLITISLLVTLIWAFLFRNRIRLSCHGPGVDVFSKVPATFITKLSGGFVPPIFDLSFFLDFDRLATRTVHVVRGRMASEGQFAEQLLFPHRGQWNFGGIVLSFGDLFGLCRFKWRADPSPGFNSIEVSPGGHPMRSYPVITSSWREGDAIMHTDRRVGDPYDIKAYHPTDGVKKIIWKLYAKSGELYSRHPEPSMTPEGKVVVFGVASVQEDNLCTEIFGYLESLEELRLETLFACEGVSQGGHSFDASPATTPQAALDMLIQCAWNTEATSPESLVTDLKWLLEKSKGVNIKKVVLFGSASRINSEKSAALFKEIGLYLSRCSIDPVFCFLEKHPRAYDAPKPSAVRSLIERVALEPNLAEMSTHGAHYASFLNVCANASWQVVV